MIRHSVCRLEGLGDFRRGTLSMASQAAFRYFLVRSGWSLLFPGAFWMVGGISWCGVDGHCYFLVCSGWSLYFLVCSGWSLLFLDVLWMVTVIPGALWMVSVISRGAMDGRCCSLLCAQARQITHTNTTQSTEAATIKKKILCAGAPTRLLRQLTTNVRSGCRRKPPSCVVKCPVCILPKLIYSVPQT